MGPFLLHHKIGPIAWLEVMNPDFGGSWDKSGTVDFWSQFALFCPKNGFMCWIWIKFCSCRQKIFDFLFSRPRINEINQKIFVKAQNRSELIVMGTKNELMSYQTNFRTLGKKYVSYGL